MQFTIRNSRALISQIIRCFGNLVYVRLFGHNIEILTKSIYLINSYTKFKNYIFYFTKPI